MTDYCLNSALAETVCICPIIGVIEPYLVNIDLCGIFMLYLAKKSLNSFDDHLNEIKNILLQTFI